MLRQMKWSGYLKMFSRNEFAFLHRIIYIGDTRNPYKSIAVRILPGLQKHQILVQNSQGRKKSCGLEYGHSVNMVKFYN